MPDEVHELTLTTLAYGGEALGHLDDGRAAFVPFGLPGERVRIRLIEERGHFVKGELVEVLQAAAERIPARCKHFGMCGGCHYQHLPYSSQIEAKAHILRDQLRRIAGIEQPPVAAVVPSPDEWNYRNHIQFHLTQQGKLGFVRARPGGEADAVLPIEECHLPQPGINALWPQLDFDGTTGVERVGVRLGSDGDPLLVLESSAPKPPDIEIEAEISIAHTFDGDTVVMSGEDWIVLSVLGRDFRVSAGSFFQVNTAMAEKMVQHVMEAISGARETVIDAYCGVGLFSAFLAPHCKRLIGIESSAAACEDFAANLDEFNNVDLYEDAVERALPALEVRPDAILVDPPRAGLELPTLDAIVRMQPPTLVYVSCDPATLARDTKRLIAGGFRLRSVTPFDLFPQTYHIESISTFER